MNAQDYRAAGYALSVHIEQTTIERVEREMIAAYISPIAGVNIDVESEPYRAAIMVLSFVSLALENVAVTRIGGKTKNANNSSAPTRAEILQQYAPTAAMHIKAIRKANGDSTARVYDILGLYFSTNFINM